jgi:hypothetical protein
MPSLFQRGTSMIQAGLKRTHGTAATYRRGATDIAITATIEGGGADQQYVSKLGNTPEDTVYTLYPPEAGYCGFLVDVADLATLTPAQPERGDKIIVDGSVYVIEAPAGVLPWKYADLPFKTWFWCHTKLA